MEQRNEQIQRTVVVTVKEELSVGEAQPWGCQSEEVGFEPTEPFGSSVFKTDAIDRSATPPSLNEREVSTLRLRVATSIRGGCSHHFFPFGGESQHQEVQCRQSRHADDNQMRLLLDCFDHVLRMLGVEHPGFPLVDVMAKVSQH